MSLPSFVLVALALFVVASGSATAASLLTSANIKDGSIQNRDLRDGAFTLSKLRNSTKAALREDSQLTLDRLAALEAKAGIPGPKGDPGASGVSGAGGKDGASGAKGADGAAGAKGDTGEVGNNGTDGKDGANPAVPVGQNGAEGFRFSGGPTMASFRDGALHVPGGFDVSTPQGAIGLTKGYDNVPLSTFSALGYTFSENKRSATDKASVHVTVVGAVKGQDSKFASGFTNLVYNPVYNGLASARDATVDGFAGGNKWYSTGAQGADGTQAAPISIQVFMARNPDAKIVQIAFDNGGSSNGTSAPEDTDISIDNAVIGFGSTFTRYDFGK